MKGIIFERVVPLRREASEASEMLTQLLFAQTVDVLEEQPKWLRVRNDEDGQEGWADAKMVTIMTDEEAASIAKADRSARVKTPTAVATFEDSEQTIPLTAGTTLPDYKKGRFSVLGEQFTIYEAMVAPKPIAMNEETVLDTLWYFQNIPYLWGGKNGLGLDCSGFTQVAMSLFGKSILRNASEQATQGTPVSRAEAQAGDLAFFDHEDGKICHVGIMVSAEDVMHCSGCVKMERLDEMTTHHLVQIRRY